MKYRTTERYCLSALENQSQSYPDLFSCTVTQVCISVVNEEIHCNHKQGEESSFQSMKAKEYKDLYRIQLSELQKYASFLVTLITKIAMNPKAAYRNKLKATESLIPSMMNAVGTLLHCRNRSMNSNALLKTSIFPRGKVDKMCVQRFQKLCLCLSYASLKATCFDKKLSWPCL